MTDDSPIRPARLPKSDVRRTYTRIAPTHDWLARLVEAEARQLAIDWLDVEDGETVLEVAVGTGLSFQHFLAQNPNGWTVGVDLTPAMLRRAKRRAERASTDRYRLQLGDAYDLDFEANTFDALFNSYMFDLLPKDDFTTVLSEFRRVLRPGGRLVLANMTTGRRWYNQLWSTIYWIHPSLLGGCRNVRIAPYLEKTGFTNVRRRYVSQWTFPSEVLYAERPNP